MCERETLAECLTCPCAINHPALHQSNPQLEFRPEGDSINSKLSPASSHTLSWNDRCIQCHSAHPSAVCAKAKAALPNKLLQNLGEIEEEMEELEVCLS